MQTRRRHWPLTQIVPWSLVTALVYSAVLAASVLNAQRPATSDRAVAGTVWTAEGKPAAGAFVKVTSDELGLTVAVFSGADGRFSARGLRAGTHVLTAEGGGFVAPPTKVQPDGGTASNVTLRLTSAQDPASLETSTDIANLLPGNSAIKTVLISACSGCHRNGLREIVTKSMTKGAWEQTYKQMETHSPIPISPSERAQLLDYLATHFGPSNTASRYTPPQPRRAGWWSGETLKARITEYKLPQGAYSHDVSVDSKGVAWLCEKNTGYLGRFDPVSLTYTRIQVPYQFWGIGRSVGYSLNAIAVDAQDRVWLTDGGPLSSLVRYDIKTGQFRSYKIPPPPKGGGILGNTIRPHPNGTIWYTQIGAGQVIRVNPDTGQVTQFPVPVGDQLGDDVYKNEMYGVAPYGMAIDTEGLVWFAEYMYSRVSRIHPDTGEIVQYGGFEKHSNLRRMNTDAAGDVWLGAYGGVGRLVKVDHRSGKATEYATPTKYSGAYSVDVDKTTGYVWVNEMLADQMARFDPRTNTFVEYPIPTTFSSVRRIEVDRSRPGRVWYNGWFSDTVGFIEIEP